MNALDALTSTRLEDIEADMARLGYIKRGRNQWWRDGELKAVVRRPNRRNRPTWVIVLTNDRETTLGWDLNPDLPVRCMVILCTRRELEGAAR